jgi:hypothetical protein
MCYMFILFSIIIIEIIIILYFIFKYKHIKEFFDNSKNDLFTYDSCCNETQIANCEKYGKTGVCNYDQNDNSCICQNAV